MKGRDLRSSNLPKVAPVRAIISDAKNTEIVGQGLQGRELRAVDEYDSIREEAFLGQSGRAHDDELSGPETEGEHWAEAGVDAVHVVVERLFGV